MKTRLKTGHIACMAALAITGEALVINDATAQTRTGGARQAVTLDEIVVTARKRDESLLDVPVTVTALTALDIEVKDIDELNDIVDFSPGFFYGGATVGRNDRSNRRLIIRGMQVGTDVDTRQGATLFIDGAPVLGSELGSTEDVERIEVVKGPQSAYFGRATFGGAINIITKRPGDTFAGRVTAEAGRFGTTDFSLSAEGPLVEDKLAIRVTGSHYGTDGQYTNATNPSETLGARETFDVAGTLYATPSDNFSAKLRLHYWRDSDGPSASVGYGLNNGESNFNCNLPNSSLPALNGNNNWICGVPAQPTPDQIQADTVVTPAILNNLLANNTVDNPTLAFLFDPQFIDGFGLERRAWEGSLVMDYDLANGMTLSSISAYHSNEWAALDDADRRSTADLPGEFNDVMLFNNRDLEDFSQELRISSADDQRLRWMAGASYFDIKALATTGLKLTGTFRSSSTGDTNQVQTWGVFGSLAYDITDALTLSAEARHQWDEVTDGNIGAAPLSGTFKSFTPRVIVDYKPSDTSTVYASWARGNRPGEFNAALVGQPQDVLTQIAAQIGADISIDEEKLDNYEIGYKGRFWDGRAQLTAAVYLAKWSNQHTRGLATVELGDGTTTLFATTGTGGRTDLWGLELEGAVAATENLSLEGTFAINDTKIIARDCADCGILLGERDIAGLDKSLSRSPKYSGTASATYRDQLTNTYDWFVRSDFIFTGSQWATEANITKTGAAHRVNLRVGAESETLRLEVFATNLFDDKTFTGFQRFTDLAFLGGRQILTAALPERRSWGVRAAYNF
ncbi:MAG: TonB-dependent receptor [Rhodospirillaceae bacterium]